MSVESESAKALDKWGEMANKKMTPEIKSSLTSHSIAGALLALLPGFGAEGILYAFVLWHMYYRVATLSGKKFNFSAVLSGFIINVLMFAVATMLLEFLDFVLGIGFILSMLAGYFITYNSGKSFLGLLHDNK